MPCLDFGSDVGGGDISGGELVILVIGDCGFTLQVVSGREVHREPRLVFPPLQAQPGDHQDIHLILKV